MIYFRSDYSQGAHPKVLEALQKTNLEHTDGYGLDRHCENAAQMIKKLIGREDCEIHMMVGGTSCNITVISACLRPYEAVVAPRTGHIYVHETGGVEATGHRVIVMPDEDGKLTAKNLEMAWDEYEDEHTVIPKMAYISQPTESGSLYSKKELKALYEVCKKRNMYLYIDGARMASALTSEHCDIRLEELAELCDAFYLGATKNGALFGEALVISNPKMNKHFRWMIKQNCGLLAKGRLIGVQFEALLEGGEDSIYFEMARHANRLASKLRKGLEKLGCRFLGTSQTNQVFPYLPVAVVKELEKNFFFYEWTPEKNGEIVARFVTAWGTTNEDVDTLLRTIETLLQKDFY